MIYEVGLLNPLCLLVELLIVNGVCDVCSIYLFDRVVRIDQSLRVESWWLLIVVLVLIGSCS